MSFVFVSYARRDSKFAERVESFLQENGFATWRDNRNLDPYKDFTGEIEFAIRRASHIVVCLTKDVKSRKDSFVRREISYALARKKAIIPIVFPHGELPVHINNLTAIFVKNEDDEKAFQDLIKQLERPHETETPAKALSSANNLTNYLNELHDFISQRLQESVIDLLQLSAVRDNKGVDSDKIQNFDISPILLRYTGGDKNVKLQEEVIYETVADALNEYHDRLLLLGHPGAGKTTTLLVLAREAVIRCLHEDNAPIPILKSIHGWESTKYVDKRGEIKYQDIRSWATEGVSTNLLRKRRILFLLDGLDELNLDSRKEFIARINKHFLKEYLVVTSRISDYRLITKNVHLSLNGTVRLLLLKDEQIITFAKHNNRVLYNAFKKDKKLRNIARTPLLLTLLSVCYDENDIKNEAVELDEIGIFDKYIKFRFVHETAKVSGSNFDEETTRIVLGQISVDTSNYSPAVVYTLTKEDIVQQLGSQKAEDFIDFCLTMHFLYKSTNDSYEFIHAKFRDYCAGVGLVNWILNYEGEWSKVSSFYTVFDRSQYDSYSNYLIAIVLIKQRYAVTLPILERALCHKNPKIRYKAIEIIGYMGENEYGIDIRILERLRKIIAPLLLKMTKDNNHLVRSTAIKMLGITQTLESIPTLTKFLGDEDQGVIFSTKKALERLGYDQKSATDILQEKFRSWEEKDGD